MIFNMYKKELKMFLRNPFQVVFMLVAPVMLILIMGYAMSNVVGEGKDVRSDSSNEIIAYFLVEEDAEESDVEEFHAFRDVTMNSMGIVWQEAAEFEETQDLVDTNEGVALIRVSGEGFYYYRSPYNEPIESKLLRAAYHNMMGELKGISESKVTSYEIEVETVDSYTYFTFAELGLIMMYISLIVGQSIYMEKNTKAFRRIYISKANTCAMLASKVALGITIGIVQIVEVFVLSSFGLQVSWGNHAWLIMLMYLTLAVFSSTLGAVLVMFIKSRTAFNDKILVLSILIGMLGGGLTPLAFLDSVRVLSYICKLSPLYWIVNGSISLAGNQATNNHIIGMIVCAFLIVCMILVFIKKKKQEQTKGVFIYE